MTRTCNRPQCVRPVSRRGMCAACYETQRVRQNAYGTWVSQRVDADPVRAHLLALRAAGVGTRAVADATGVSRSALVVLLNGRPERGTPPPRFVMVSTAEKLLALPVPSHPVEMAATMARVPAIGFRRRVQALVANGWTMTYLAVRLGVTVTNLSAALQREHVSAKRHRDAAALFDELQLPGPSERAKAYARKRKWPLPLEWDEDMIDDPAARPVRARLTSTRSRVSMARQDIAVRREQAKALIAAGLTAAQVGERLGVDARSVERYKARSA